MTKNEIFKSLLDQADDKDRLAGGDPDSIFTEDATALREAAELLKAVPGWISVRDALPTSVGKYLVNIHQIDEKNEDYADFAVEAWYRPIPSLICNQNVGWSLLNEFYDLSDVLRDYITHWMPMPEPPEKE